MKILCFVVAVSVLFMAGCSKHEDNSDGIGKGDIKRLNEEEVSNFVALLPEVLKFSDSYYDRLSKSERESPDANLKFFKSLETDGGIKKILPLYHFSSPMEMIGVYKNVVLEYTTITREFTNYAKDLENMRSTVDSYRSNYTAALQDRTLSAEDRKLIESKLKDIENDIARLSNIVIVRKYEKEIDEAYIKQYGSNR